MTQMPRSRRPITAPMHAPSSASRPATRSLKQRPTSIPYASTSAGWFGLLARWVDAHTYYYLAVRSNGRLDIRKKVNGTITVLKSVPFAATPGTYYRFKFAVVGNELHAYVNDVFVAGAIDSAITKGQYGIGTSGSAATFQNFTVEQP